MKLVRGAWKLLVGLKDAMVLIAMLLFFGLLFTALSARPGQRTVGDGALVVEMAGALVEQPQRQAPLALLTGSGRLSETPLHDVLRTLRAAERDPRVKAVVLDLDSFGGGYPAALADVTRAVARVRQAGKPVLAYATAYTDGGYLIASAASELWVNPLGGVAVTGPGGSELYFKGLLDRLGVTAHIYKVGLYKSAVEPFSQTEASPPAKEAERALYGALFAQYRELVSRTRPEAQLDAFLRDPLGAIGATGGDLAQANLRGGLVDKLGTRAAFERRVAQVAGRDPAKPKLPYRRIAMADYLAANPLPAGGQVGVITIAGGIVDGEAEPGTAGGDTVAKLLNDGLAEKPIKALVVRVDSPGGSVMAGERIRQAILSAKARGIPVVASMGGLAASAGYYVSTPADVIFAEPNTITGSIGVFAVLPSFENALPKIGVTTDGFKTTPLSGEPDVLGGIDPTFERLLQAGIDDFYRRFIGLVGQSRKMTPQRVDQIAQGRVWDGGSARQLGLVDRFGSLDDAVAEAAKRAKLTGDAARAVYLEREPSWAEKLAADVARGNEDDAQALGLADRMLAAQKRLTAASLSQVRMLATGPAMQARCLECVALGAPTATPRDTALFERLLERWLP